MDLINIIVFSLVAYCVIKLIQTLSGSMGNQCDSCGRHLTPLVDKKIVVCQKCVDNEPH